jgi:glycosyltransferase involved in cell wall biosynthesis
MCALEFTGIVVCFNEGRFLPDCLQRLSGCVERIVIDLGSSDSSVAVAVSLGARVIEHPWVPIVERVRSFAVLQANTDWVLFLDPDLLFPQAALPTIERLIKEDPLVGVVSVPYQNHFRGKPLRFGRWGGKSNGYPVAIHRERVTLGDAVHRGIRVKAGYTRRVANATPEHLIVHEWANSYADVVRKARRYLPEEGVSRYREGDRTSWLLVALAPAKALLTSLLYQLGFLDGITGIGLSVIAAWYAWQSEISLLKYENESRRLAEPIVTINDT